MASYPALFIGLQLQRFEAISIFISSSPYPDKVHLALSPEGESENI